MESLPKNLTERLAARIRPEWLRIHAKKVEGADAALCLSEAYNVCATAVKDIGGELDDGVLCQTIPALISHWAMAMDWLSAIPEEQRYDYLAKCLRSPIEHWQAEALTLRESHECRLAQQNAIRPEEFNWVQVWREMPEALILDAKSHRFANVMRCVAAIRVELLRIDSKRLEGATAGYCVKEAYDVIARALKDSDETLNDVTLRQVIPALIINAAGDKWMVAVPREQRYEYVMNCVSGRISYWQAEAEILTEKVRFRSALLEEWEAQKEVGRLVDGPHETIPEEFVRTHLALQNGIKPEEVSWRQILLEVYNLARVSDHPAVELVPTAPVTDEDNGPWLFCRSPADMISVCRVHLRAFLTRHLSATDEIAQYLTVTDESSPPKESEAAFLDQFLAVLALYSSATARGSPLNELNAAYRDHLLAFLASTSSATDQRALLDEVRRLAEGLLAECRMVPSSPPTAQSESPKTETAQSMDAPGKAEQAPNEPQVAPPSLGSTIDQVPAETGLPTQKKETPTEVPDLDERKAAYNAYKLKYAKAGVKITEKKLARLANPAWNTRDPVMKWKAGKDQPDDDRRIRAAMVNVPPPSPS